MNILHTSRRQRGASAWTLVGSLLIAAGIAGLGVALIKPGSRTPSIAKVPAVAPAAPVAPVATRSAAAPMTADTKPAAPSAASTAITKTDPRVPARTLIGTALGGAQARTQRC